MEMGAGRSWLTYWVKAGHPCFILVCAADRAPPVHLLCARRLRFSSPRVASAASRPCSRCGQDVMDQLDQPADAAQALQCPQSLTDPTQRSSALSVDQEEILARLDEHARHAEGALA